MDHFLTFLYIISVPLFLALSFRVIRKGKAGLVKRLGKYHRTMQPGIAFILPVIEMMYIIDTRADKNISTNFHSLMTRDLAVIKLDIDASYSITDIKKITYDTTKLDSILKTLLLNSLMSFIQEKDYEELTQNEDLFNNNFKQTLSTQIAEWGLTLNTLKIYNIKLKEEN